MFRSWGAIGSPIFAEIEGGRGQNGTFLGDFTWNDPYHSQPAASRRPFLCPSDEPSLSPGWRDAPAGLSTTAELMSF